MKYYSKFFNKKSRSHQQRDNAFFQPKLSINSPNDVYEQQADAMAEKIIHMPTHENNFFKPSAKSIQRKCAHCEEEEKNIQKKSANTSESSTAPSIVSDAIHSNGHPLDGSTKSFMESGFGHDFSDVQIHDDSLAHQSSSEINALAYTHGNHIVFGEGQYQPNSPAGKQLLAHELTHVVQQSELPGETVIQMKGAKPSKGHPVKTGQINIAYEKKVIDLYIWPNAMASIAWLQGTPIGQKVWDQLIKAGVNITILFVAERSDIPVSEGLNALGFFDDSVNPFVIYALVGQEDYYWEQQGQSMVEKKRIMAIPQKQIADTLFHELLHAWFETFITNTQIPTGHTGKAVDFDALGFDPKEYAPEFLDQWKEFRQELNK